MPLMTHEHYVLPMLVLIVSHDQKDNVVHYFNLIDQRNAMVPLVSHDANANGVS